MALARRGDPTIRAGGRHRRGRRATGLRRAIAACENFREAPFLARSRVTLAQVLHDLDGERHRSEITALATAAAVGVLATSPMARLLYGPGPPGTFSATWVLSGGMSMMFGTLNSPRLPVRILPLTRIVSGACAQRAAVAMSVIWLGEQVGDPSDFQKHRPTGGFGWVRCENGPRINSA